MAQEQPRRQLSVPTLDPMPAAAVSGFLVGLLGVGLTWLGLRGCSAVRGTSSCGDPGIFLLLAIVVAMALAGRSLLATLRVPDAGSTSVLGTALTAVLVLLLVSDALEDASMAAVLPVVGAVTFGVAQWVTSSSSSADEHTR